MTVAALLPERVLLAREVASLFGGMRVRLEEGERRFDPVTLQPQNDGVDVARLFSLVEVPGQARRIAALCRRLPDVPSTTTTTTTAETAALPVLIAAFVKQLSTSTVTSLTVTPQARSHVRFAALLSACESAGIALGELHALPQPGVARLLLVDDAEVIGSPMWKTVADAGQGAMLAAGLCHDVAAFFVDAAGPEGKECFDKGFDDVGRAWFVQRIERALRAGFGSPVVRLTGNDLVPPLSSSTSKLAQLGADASEKARALSNTLRALQERQRQALARVNLELRLPAARDSWWTEKLAGLDVVAGDVVGLVGASSPALAGLKSALVARGVVVERPGASWLHQVADESGHLPVALAMPEPAAPAPKAVGGVRATVDFDVSLPVAVVDIAAPVPEVSITSMISEPREVELPAAFRDLWVRVDDQVVDVDAAGPRVRLEVPVRHGSVVVVAWDDDDDGVDSGASQ
ncbi:MAG: hypothetical protein Q8O67_28230 [Deltaproteobacteria bacterium]|nr:hypothetical protein [Deltaproteobacteria bacterium]